MKSKSHPIDMLGLNNGEKCHSEPLKPLVLSLKIQQRFCLPLGNSKALQELWVADAQPDMEAPLGKGEAMNYFYSLEMTYLIHSVNYLPSAWSSQTYESRKPFYL